VSGCLSDSGIVRLLAGDASDPDESRNDEHLRNCPSCLERLDARTVVPDSVRQTKASGPGEDDGTLDALLDTVTGAHVLLARDLPGYELIREIGRGGSGVILEALRRSDGATVALKMIGPHTLPGPSELARLRLEAEAVAELRHPNIVRVQEVMEHDGQPVLCMEYVRGEDLAARLNGTPRCSTTSAHLVEILARAIHAVHEAGYLHRDLKPANVLLDAGAEPGPGVWVDAVANTTAALVPKITDFGLAKRLGIDYGLTGSSAALGTPSYMSPEQVDGIESVTRATDVYSLGAILYEALVGRPPFDGRTAIATMADVVHERPVAPHLLVGGVSRDLEAICLKCLEKDPAQRYASAGALANELRRVQDGVRTLARPARTAFHGRETESAVLRASFARAQAGDGRVVLIQGEAGIGKCRLVDEFLTTLRVDGTDVEILAGSYPPGGAAAAADAFVSAFRGHRALADTHQSTAHYSSGLVRAARSLAATRATVLWIDDLQSAPTEGLALVATVAAACAGERLLLVATTRPELPADAVATLEEMPHSECMRLAPLKHRDIEAILTDVLGSEPLTRKLSGPVATRSGGNPFFALELVAALRRGNLLRQQDDGVWTLTGDPAEIGVPDIVRELNDERLDALSHDDRALLDVAACVGVDFDPLLVADVLGIDHERVGARFEIMAQEHGIVRRSGHGLAFEQPLMQETLRAGLSDVFQKGYDRAISDALGAQET
jgi:serine/threonine protein kinase